MASLNLKEPLILLLPPEWFLDWTYPDVFQKNGYLPAGTWRPGDIPWRSPKGPKLQDLQDTFRKFLRDQHKNWWFNEKIVF